MSALFLRSKFAFPDDQLTYQSYAKNVLARASRLKASAPRFGVRRRRRRAGSSAYRSHSLATGGVLLGVTRRTDRAAGARESPPSRPAMAPARPARRLTVRGGAARASKTKGANGAPRRRRNYYLIIGQHFRIKEYQSNAHRRRFLL